MTAIPAVIRFFSAQFWGSAIDRAGRQKPFVLAGLGGFSLLLALLAAVRTPGMTVALISIGAVLYSAASPAARTMATLIDEGLAGELDRSNPTLSTYLKWESVGWLVGGMASGFLLDYFPVTMKHLLLAASLIAALTVLSGLYFLTDPPVGARRTGRAPEVSRESNLWQSLKTLYRRPEFSSLLLLLFFTFFARESFFTTYGIYLSESLQGGTTLYGVSLTVATLFGIFLYDAASLLAKRMGSVQLIRMTASVYALGYTVTVAFPHPWVLAGYFSLPLFPFLTMSSASAVSELSAAQEHARGLGILEAANLLAVALGSVSAGAIAGRWGLATVPIVSLVMGAIGILAGNFARVYWKARLEKRYSFGRPRD